MGGAALGRFDADARQPPVCDCDAESGTTVRCAVSPPVPQDEHAGPGDADGGAREDDRVAGGGDGVAGRLGGVRLTGPAPARSKGTVVCRTTVSLSSAG
jgi:hypothetical protein